MTVLFGIDNCTYEGSSPNFFLILSEFKRVNELLFSLKSSENLRGDKNSLIHTILATIQKSKEERYNFSLIHFTSMLSFDTA